MSCNHPLRYTPSLLYLESCCDGIWRNHSRDGACVTSTTTEEVAGNSKDTRRIQPKPKNQLSRTVRPVGGLKSTQNCVSMAKKWRKRSNKNGETRSGGQKKRSTKLISECLDCHMQLWKKQKTSVFANSWRRSRIILIEKHFKPICRQHNVYNPFSKNSKEMIRELGNVELFELCETIPKVQCSHCLFNWNQGIVHCTCGHFLVDSESKRKFNNLRLDALSIPHYVIKKGRCHGSRHGKTEEQKENQKAWNAWKRCCKKVDSQGEHFTGIHDRFLRDSVYRESQFAIWWTEQKCKEMDELAKEDHTYHLSRGI